MSLLFLFLIILQWLVLKANTQEENRGLIHSKIARLEQDEQIDISDEENIENTLEESDAPEDVTENTPSNNDADALSTIARTFDPASSLRWVETYMEESDSNPEEFCTIFDFIARSSSGNADNEVALIEANYPQNQGNLESFYRNLRNILHIILYLEFMIHSLEFL